ncbi:MAG: alginate export family protein [Planctomycetes bacterium]|nr:alginate export family protein [Planctomycetota bacterium]
MHRTMKLLVFGLMALSAIAFQASAQNDQDLRSELRRLNEELRRISTNQDALAVENQRLAADNAELKRRLDTGEVSASDLEASINALASELDYAGTTVNSAANPITMMAHFRFRAGYTTNRDFGADFGPGNNGDDDSGTFIDARVNIAFEYALSKNVTTHFEVISNGEYHNGDTPNSGSNLDNVELYQGWVLLDKLFGRDEIGLRTGRQEIVLGDQWHFGNNDFFGGETFDSTLVWWGQKEFSITFIWAKLAIDDNFTTRNHPYDTFGAADGYDDDEIYTLYFTYKNIENHVIDLYWVYFSGDFGGSVGTLGGPLSDGDSDVHAIGIRVAGVFKDIAAGLDYKAEFTYETGDLDVLGLDVDNWAVEAGLGITFNSDNLFRIFIRFLFSEGADGSDAGFLSAYPNRHMQVNWDDHTAIQARYGLMDIIPMTNVITAQIGFTVNPSDCWQFGATFLGAWHDEEVVTTDATLDDGIGYEIDVFAHYRHSAETTITFAFGVFIPEEGAPLVNSATAAGSNEDSAAFLFFIQSLTTF